MLYFSKIIFIICFSSIGYINAATITIKSDPEKGAEVFVRELAKSEFKKLGKIPFESPLAEITNNFVTSKFFVIEIRKEGFIPYRMVLNDIGNSDLKINANLQAKIDHLKFRKIDTVVGKIFEAQGLIRAKQLDEGITKLKKLEKEAPFLSIVPELIGSTYYLKNENKMAYSWFSKAYRINPQNRDAFTMKNYLEKALGIKTLRNKDQ